MNVSGFPRLWLCSPDTQLLEKSVLSIHETDKLSFLWIMCQITCHGYGCLSGWVLRHGPSPLASQLQVTEPQRYAYAPSPPPALLQGRLIYLTEFRRDQHQLVQKDFASMGFPTQLQSRSGFYMGRSVELRAPVSFYMIYPVARPKSSQIGKMP